MQDNAKAMVSFDEIQDQRSFSRNGVVVAIDLFRDVLIEITSVR